MKKTVGIILLFCSTVLSAASRNQAVVKIESFSQKVSESFYSQAKQSVAISIFDFDNQTPRLKELNTGAMISDIVEQVFKKSGKYLLTERKQLAKILETFQLQQTGIYDSDKLPAIGKLIGCQYVLVGAVSEIGADNHIVVKIIKVETGEVVVTESMDLPSVELDAESKKYQPPSYRIGGGILMNQQLNESFPPVDTVGYNLLFIDDFGNNLICAPLVGRS